MNTATAVKTFPEEFVPYNEQLRSVLPGDNILCKVGDSYYLMKYEGHNTSVESYNQHRCNRHTFIMTSKCEKSLAQQRREWRRYKGNIYGTHRLDFKPDAEFGLFLPSSDDSDLFLTVARESSDGEVTLVGHQIEVIIDPDEILVALQQITRPLYFETNVLPFLESRGTGLHVPRWNSRWYRRVNALTLHDRFEKQTRQLKHGDFVYVGCKEEVYLLGLARGDNGRPYMQGTYTTSVKPMFYFSNNTHNVLGFDKHPFVHSQLGRKQNCINAIFTGEPQLITGDLEEALEHFATTDFAEFADVVRRYAKQIHVVHPSFGPPNGKFYY